MIGRLLCRRRTTADELHAGEQYICKCALGIEWIHQRRHHLEDRSDFGAGPNGAEAVLHWRQSDVRPGATAQDTSTACMSGALSDIGCRARLTPPHLPLLGCRYTVPGYPASTLPLQPASITVQPASSLIVRYFIQTDVQARLLLMAAHPSLPPNAQVDWHRLKQADELCAACDRARSVSNGAG